MCWNPEAAVTKLPWPSGPEGGWTEDELQSFQQAGWISASLGNTILSRPKTAANRPVAGRRFHACPRSDFHLAIVTHASRRGWGHA